MKIQAIILFLLLWTAKGVAQTTATSFYAEFAYVGIPADDPVLTTMYGYQRLRLYVDDKFIKLETDQELPEAVAQQYGPGLKMSMVYQKDGGELYMCAKLDDNLIRTKGEEKDHERFKAAMQGFNNPEAPVHGAGAQQQDILGHTCSEIFIPGTFKDSISAFVTQNIQLDKTIADFPLHIVKNGTDYGVLLGRDEILWDGKKVAFRATKIELNQSRDIASELKAYKLVSEEKANELMKKWFMKPPGGKH